MQPETQIFNEVLGFISALVLNDKEQTITKALLSYILLYTVIVYL